MNTKDVTRFEIIDHRPCKHCEGLGWLMMPDPTHMEEPTQVQCQDCQGGQMRGRTVVDWDENLEFEVQLQDEGRTLKVFIKER